MKYQVYLANNIRTIQPELPLKTSMDADGPLTIVEIAGRAGVHPLLLVAGVVEGEVHPLDVPVAHDAEIVLFGPVAGG